jgi:hypothetical protein
MQQQVRCRSLIVFRFPVVSVQQVSIECNKALTHLLAFAPNAMHRVWLKQKKHRSLSISQPDIPSLHVEL